MSGLAVLKNAESKRISSWDRSGGNADFLSLKGNSTVALAEINGAGAVKHMWFTINSSSLYHLRELVLRMYWDGETATAVDNFYYHVDSESYPDESATANKGRFHAQWRRELTQAVPDSGTGGKNLDGKNNHVFMEAAGRGQYVGVILNVQGFSTGWWGEGDDMFFIDGQKSPPSIDGTGLEDYFG